MIGAGIELILKHPIDFEDCEGLGRTITRLSVIANAYAPAYVYMVVNSTKAKFWLEIGTCIVDDKVPEKYEEFKDEAASAYAEFSEAFATVVDEFTRFIRSFDINGVRSSLNNLVGLLSSFNRPRQADIVERLSSDVIAKVKRGVWDKYLAEAVNTIITMTANAVYEHVVKKVGRKYLVLNDQGGNYSVVIIEADTAGVYELPNTALDQDLLLARLLPKSVVVSEDVVDEDTAFTHILRGADKYMEPLLRAYLRSRGFDVSGLSMPEVRAGLSSGISCVPSITRSILNGHMTLVMELVKPIIIEYMDVGIRVERRDATTIIRLLEANKRIGLIQCR